MTWRDVFDETFFQVSKLFYAADGVVRLLLCTLLPMAVWAAVAFYACYFVWRGLESSASNTGTGH